MRLPLLVTAKSGVPLVEGLLPVLGETAEGLQILLIDFS